MEKFKAYELTSHCQGASITPVAYYCKYMENTLQGIGSFIPIRFLVSEKMTEELDPTAQDSDGGSEEVVLTPAELIESLEQVRINKGGYFTELL